MGQLCERLGERPVKFVFLATEHPGIPDIEILDKLLDVRSALLTQDRVLHNLAIGRGFQSFVHTPESGLTDRRLVHVSASDKHLPVASSALRDSYRHQSDPEAQAITECLYSFLSAHQLKQFRTKRRRIRAHFGSPDNIVAAALTIGQAMTKKILAISSGPPDRRKQGPIQFLENNPIQSSLWVRFMCPKTRRNWLRLPIVRFHPGSSCPQQPP